MLKFKYDSHITAYNNLFDIFKIFTDIHNFANSKESV